MTYKAVFHLDQNEKPVINLALNNVINLLRAIPEKNHDLVVLFNGPAAHLVAKATVGEFHDRVKSLTLQGVRFQVCRNAMERFHITEEQIIAECDIIPAGIVTLIDLQNDAFAYIKP